MSAIPAGQLVQWIFRAVPAVKPGVEPITPFFPPVEEIQKLDRDIEQLKRIDEPPASPDPKQKPDPKATPKPKPEPQPEPQPFDQDRKTCQLMPPNNQLSKKLKTQVVIAGNCEQAMRDAYNRGYATGRAVSKSFRDRCPLIKADGEFLRRRLKRIILQQENGPRKTIKVSSRHGGGVLDELLDAAT